MTPKRSNNGTLILDTNPKIETLENINIVENSGGNMSEFTLNRNNNDFMQVVNNTVNGNNFNQNSGNTGNNGNSSTMNSMNNNNQHTHTHQQQHPHYLGVNLKNQINGIDTKLEEALNILNKNNSGEVKDKVSFHVKKFSLLKRSFDEYTKVVNSEDSLLGPLGRNMLMKISEGFNESLQVVVSSYNKINEKMSDYDTLSTSKKE